MGAHHFPCPGCLVTVIKPVRTWLLALHCSTLCITYCKWQPPGRPFDFHLAMGSAPVQSLCMCAPPKFSIKEVRTTSPWLTFG